MQAGVPSLIPEVMNGLSVSNGIPFLLQVILALPNEACASLPVTLNDLRSRSIRCVSVPPEKILKPFSDNLSDKIFAFLITFFVYILNSSDKASLKQTALAAITCISGPPCKPGKIALLNFLANSSLFVKMIPPLGPLKTLCVVEVTTSAYLVGLG